MNRFADCRDSWLLCALCALLLALGTAACSRSSERNVLSHNGTNVLLVVLDTVRADRLSCYGNTEGLTPAIDAIARRGVLFERAFSNSSWTLPAHASLFTGTYPITHRATQETLFLSEDLPTLAEVYSEAGYETFASSANPIASGMTGLARGFDTFIEAFLVSFQAQQGAADRHPNNQAFKSFLVSREPERPFFAFLNYIEAHSPYAAPEPFRDKLVDPALTEQQVRAAMKLTMPNHYLGSGITAEEFAVVNQLYNAEIAYLDEVIDGLMRVLERHGDPQNTLVILTSDHGENIGDHGHFGHVFSVHNTLLNLPLIFLFPDGRHTGETRKDVVQLLDLFPTALKQSGIAYTGDTAGRDLFAPGAASVDATVMAEYYYPKQVLSLLDPAELKLKMDRVRPYLRRLRTLQNGRMKLTWGSDGLRELYRIDRDSDEKVNLLEEHHLHPAKERMMAKLAERVRVYQGGVPLDPSPALSDSMTGLEERVTDEAVFERLRSLGYVR